MTRNTALRLLLMLLAMAGSQPAGAMTPQERREYLAKLQQILPDAPAFREWLQKTGELPPDFDALPRINGLQPCCRGRPIHHPAAGEHTLLAIDRSRPGMI